VVSVLDSSARRRNGGADDHAKVGLSTTTWAILTASLPGGQRFPPYFLSFSFEGQRNKCDGHQAWYFVQNGAAYRIGQAENQCQ